MTGVGQVALQILENLPLAEEPIGVLLPKGSSYRPVFTRFKIHTTGVDLTQHPLTDLFEQFLIPLLCYRYGYGAFVSFEGRVPALHPGLRTFSMIHDLAFLKVSSSHSRKYSAFLWLSLKISVLTATRILTVSQAAREDLIRLGRAAPASIVVIPNADSSLHKWESHPVPNAKVPYFLAVSMTNPRKNLGRLLAGFALFRRQAPEFTLVLTGNPEFIEAECRQAKSEGVVNLGFVDEGSLRNLYENAIGMVYPSLDEGFGIPLLDALRFDCPVLCSDIPVFREVAEDAARYFDPFSPESISKTLEASRNKWVSDKGRRVLEKYSWGKSAASLLDGIRGSLS